MDLLAGGFRRLDFRARRPGRVFEIKTDLDRERAVVQRIDVNAWGVTRLFYTFTGVHAGDARNERDWTLTRVWAFSKTQSRSVC